MAIDLGNSINIEKMNDSNFHARKQKIVFILALKELEDFIGDDPPTVKSECAKWIESDCNARILLGPSLLDDHLKQVREVTIVREIGTASINVFLRHRLLYNLSAHWKI